MRGIGFRKFAALALAVIFIGLSGCSNGTGKNTPIPTASPSPIPVAGGTLRLYAVKPDTLDPMFSKSIYVQRYSRMIFDPLFEVDGRMKTIPVLVSDYSISDDGKTWTFTLKPGVKWHDGSDLTADDVAATFLAINAAKDGNIYKSSISGIKDLKADGSDKFIVTLSQADYFLPALLVFPIQKKDYKDNATAPMGTGPYRFESSDDASIRLLPNNLLDESGPYISEILIRIFDGTKMSEKEALVTKEIDAAIINDGDYARFMSILGFDRETYVSDRFDCLAFNTKRPKLADKTVRQAIARAIDQKKLADSVLGGKAVVSDMPLVPDSEYNFGNDLSITFDMAEAKNLFAESGMSLSNGLLQVHDPVRQIDAPFALEILVNDGNEFRLNAAKYIDAQLKKAGVSSYIRSTDYASYLADLKSGNFDIAITGIKTVPNASGDLGIYQTGNADGLNIAGYSNAEVDNIIKNIHNMNQTDVSSIQNSFWRLKEILNDELPYFGLYFYLDAIAFGKNVKGVSTPDAWRLFDGVAGWYITQAVEGTN